VYDGLYGFVTDTDPRWPKVEEGVQQFARIDFVRPPTVMPDKLCSGFVKCFVVNRYM
jgi:hypothetical protein